MLLNVVLLLLLFGLSSATSFAILVQHYGYYNVWGIVHGYTKDHYELGFLLFSHIASTLICSYFN